LKKFAREKTRKVRKKEKKKINLSLRFYFRVLSRFFAGKFLLPNYLT